MCKDNYEAERAYRIATSQIQAFERDREEDELIRLISKNEFSPSGSYTYGYHRGIKDILERLGLSP